MQDPTVSVIVTTYNREELLKETLQSILNQTYTDFELIVVDNFSDYDFFKVIEEIGDNRIRPFQNANNGIISVNRNFGISKATGKYLAFCDDDDLWMPEKLNKQLEILIQKDADVVSTAALCFGQRINTDIIRSYKYKCKNQVFTNNYLTYSSVMVKNTTDILFDEDSKIIASEDWALWMKLTLLGYTFIQINDVLVKYRMNETNSTLKYTNTPGVKGLLCLKKMRKSFPKRMTLPIYIYSVIYCYLIIIEYKFGLHKLIHKVKKCRV